MALGLVVVDTDLVIDFLRGRGAGATWVAQLIAEGRFRTTAVTAFELRLGADFLERRADVVRMLRSRTLPFDLKAAIHAGTAYSTLKSEGQPIGYGDTLIAGTCLRFGLPLATRKLKHFGRVHGLELVSLPDGTST